MFEEFSSGYYLGRLYVRPADTDRALMHRDQHERANEALYATGEGVERLDAPLVMKLEETHFPVHGGDAVPQDTLLIPDELFDGVRSGELPALREVLVAKANRAQQLLRWTGGWQPAAGT